MDRIENVNLERIRWCCDDVGIALEELPRQVGIAPSTWDKFVHGERGLTFNQLRKIADSFNRGVLFFLEERGIDERRLRSPQFRTLANQRPDLSPEIKALIERVEMQRDIYLSLLEDLGDDEASRFAPPELPRNSARAAAEVARQWLGLNGQATFSDYRKAVEERGVLVFRTMGYQGQWRIPEDSGIAGFSVYEPRCPVIVVRKQQSEKRQNFTLMHELGHVLLHRSSFVDDEDTLFSREGRERSANAFAGFVLVPDKHLNTIDDATRPLEVSEYYGWLRQDADNWGVSAEVILRRLMDSGRLERELYEAYRVWSQRQPIRKQEGGSRQWRNREPLHIFGSRFVRTIFDALHARQITLNKASGYLDNLKVKDVHKLEEHLANV